MAIDTTRLDRMIEIVKANEPEIFKLAAPRRYTVPTGYLNPIYNGMLLASYFIETKQPEAASDATVVVNSVLASKLLDLMVPTYFVAEPFLRAVLATDPPKDFKLSELFWPMEAMTIALPQDLMREYTGQDIPFISLGLVEKGKFKSKYMPFQQEIEIAGSTVIFSWTVFSGDTHYDYAGNFPLDWTVSQVSKEDTFTDYTSGYKQALLTAVAPEREPGLTKEQDVALAQKMYSLGVKLLLAMTARPHMIENGTCVRPAKIKHGRTKEELWSPNMIGASYKVVHAKSEHQGGTHSSPRLHWRRGHYRYQAYGPGLTLRKLIPIDPVLVGGEPTIWGSRT